jgi:cellulose biosynthesis protein BcsQ
MKENFGKEELEHKLMPILEQYDVVVVDAKESLGDRG